VPTLHPLVALAVGVVVMQISTLATTVYLHRGVTHRAVNIKPAAAVPLRFIIWVTTGMRPREWAAVHRRHHAKVDTVDDPHSPLVLGFWRVQLGNVFMYHRAVHDREQVARYSKDLPPDRLDRMFFDHDVLGPLLGTAFLCAVLGWPTGLLAAGIHLVLYVGVNSAVNAVGHTYGQRSDATTSATNNQLLAFFTMGEGQHNNHHAAPTSAKFSFERGQVDAGWRVVQLMQRFGWLTVRHPDVRVLTHTS
jgi:stearoyl-CoA desaturase (Delta-9 desaturase)